MPTLDFALPLPPVPGHTQSLGVIQGKDPPAPHTASCQQRDLRAKSRPGSTGAQSAWEAGLDIIPESLQGGAQPVPMLGTQGANIKSHHIWCIPKLKDKLWTTPGLRALVIHHRPMLQSWHVGNIWRSLVFRLAQPSLRCWELAFPPHPSPLWIPARVHLQFPRQQHSWRWERRRCAAEAVMTPMC